MKFGVRIFWDFLFDRPHYCLMNYTMDIALKIVAPVDSHQMAIPSHHTGDD